MFAVINKYLKPKHPVQAKWFAEQTVRVIYDKFKTHPDRISQICVFYNREIKCCIVRYFFDENLATLIENKYLYVLFDYHTGEMAHYGNRFENGISDNGRTITWIQNNKVLVFYPDNETMSLLPAQLHKKTPESFL